MTSLIDDLAALASRRRPIPSALRAARLALGADRASRAALAILRWLADRATDRPLHPLAEEKPSLAPNGDAALAADLATLLEKAPELAASFAWRGGALDFATGVELRERRRLERAALEAVDARIAAPNDPSEIPPLPPTRGG